MCAGVANPWIMSEILLHMLNANSLKKKFHENDSQETHQWPLWELMC